MDRANIRLRDWVGMAELETMKLHLHLVVAALTGLSLHQGLAQNIYGFQQNVIPWQQGLYLAGYDVLGDTWVWGDTLDYAEGFGLGSSTYDQWEDNYVFLGVAERRHGRPPMDGTARLDARRGVFRGI